MPVNKLGEFIKRLTNLEKQMTDHLMESGSIKTQLKFNTWLTGVIAGALILRGLAEFFK